MPDDTPSNEAFARLSGERGGDVQFEWMAAFVKQYIAVTMGRIQFLPAEGVAVTGQNQPMIFVP